MRLACPIVVLLCVQAAGGGGETRQAPRPRLNLADKPGKILGQVVAMPSSINFTAPDPDYPIVPASSPARISWRGNGSDGGPNWTLWVQADASAFDSCPGVPASKITVSCQTAQGDGGVTAACAPSGGLSASPRMLATGTQVNGAKQYSVVMTFTLEDSWRHVAATTPPCTLNLTYTVDFP